MQPRFLDSRVAAQPPDVSVQQTFFWPPPSYSPPGLPPQGVLLYYQWLTPHTLVGVSPGMQKLHIDKWL